MADSIIVLCPGQGAQFVGMGRAWRERSPEAAAVFAAADEILAAHTEAPVQDLGRLCFEGPDDQLNRTDISQPAIYTTSIACWRGLLASRGLGENDIRLRATAGLSLGEYTALTIAGALSFEDGLRLVALRGRAMQDAAEASSGGMVAIIGGDDEQAMAVCAEAAPRGGADILVGANFNAPGQVVLSGSLAACERAVKIAGERGLRATPLPVAGAFHSPLMAPAAERLAQALARVEIRPPRCPVYSNVTATSHETEPGGPGAGRGAGSRPDQPFAGLPFANVRQLLVEQLTAPVRWSDQCRNMIADLGGSGGSETPGEWGSGWIELAPGRTLAGLMRRIDRSVKVENFDEP